MKCRILQAISVFFVVAMLLLSSISVEAQEQQNFDNLLNESNSLEIPANTDRVIKSIDEHITTIDERISNMDSAGGTLNSGASELVQDAASLAAGDTGITVTDLGTELKIALVGDILFDFDKANLRPDAMATLEKLSAFLMHHQVTKFRIEGHTDSKGSEAHNLDLSQQRADSVATWLESAINNGEIEISTIGKAAAEPVAPNANPNGSDNPDGRQKNRRVEIFVPKS